MFSYGAVIYVCMGECSLFLYGGVFSFACYRLYLNSSEYFDSLLILYDALSICPIFFFSTQPVS